MRISKVFNAILLSGLCAVAINASAQEIPTLQNGVLTIGSDLTWAPFDYYDKNVPAGFDAELMAKISKGLGLTPRIDDTRFANLVIGLSGKKFDVVASALYITPARAKQIDYVPYLKTGGSLMTLKGSEFRPETVNDLCGKKVASLKGAAWVPTLTKLSSEHCTPSGKGAIGVQEYESSPMAAQALLSKAADVQFEDAAVAQMLIKQTKGRLEITSKTIIEPVVIGLGVEKGNTVLAAALTEQLDRLKQNGEYQAMLTAYNLQEPTKDDIAAAYSGK
ncbi:ABC transporter substrate-binding protein [Pseudomonas silesiensis]|uniref:ABC transporter substrate-binding protein n=1 Tax=Pseudomonas silesiensis TaxID=1853130 RepID=A0A191YTU6_9PSED|nr:transporter substrate-binding domain-containing protein [Pseudomonas silesiensis]ANJ56302.1 ABC transporter substrate-binding protein [Pseudomonas silesiensis]